MLKLRYLTIFLWDALATAVALTTAFLLRFDGDIPSRWIAVMKLALPVLVASRLLAVFAARLYRWSFRMSGFAEALRLLVATLGGSALFIAAFPFVSAQGLPRSVLALEFFLSGALMGGVRFAPRIAFGWYSQQQRARKGAMRRTLVVGAGSAGDLLVRDLMRSTDHPYEVVGFVDDDPAKLGMWLGGRPVLGRTDALPALIARHQVTMVMLAIQRMPAERIREILQLCSSQKASFKIIPASFGTTDGRSAAAMLHDLSPDDLLPRDEVAFDEVEVRALLEGKRLLVTGGAGSIGSEIARQAAVHGVRQLVLADMNENEMYLLARRLRQGHPQADIHTEVADVRDPARMLQLGERYRPHFVFHAAAHKHVPLMEDAPEEAVKNNVLGTLNAARMASACGAERFVFISTDKAVRPSSVMGASKRVGEYLVRDLARHSRTQMTAVRFGNVLGSAGSVVPLFKQQIERGGPVTVTHPECTRYFMTISEAVGLVLLAGLGGYGDLCVLDMGEPIRIADLAHHLITMAGYIPGQEIQVVYSGLRPGEKLHEAPLTEDEERAHLVRNRIKVAKSPAPPLDLHERVEELRKLAELGDRAGVVRVLGQLVPSYVPHLAHRPPGTLADVLPLRHTPAPRRGA